MIKDSESFKAEKSGDCFQMIDILNYTFKMKIYFVSSISEIQGIFLALF